MTSQQIADLGPWFHNLHLPDGTQTAPDHPLGDFPAFKWRQIAPHVPEDLRGWTVLDIGCNAGFYTFQMAERGARVTAIDVDPHYLAQARWAAEQFGVTDRVEFHQMQVYELAQWGRRFDLILFLGVFYHLRYPLLGLDIVSRAVDRMLFFQTLMMPGKDVLENTREIAPTGLKNVNDRDILCHPGWARMAFIEHEFAGDPTNWWAPNRAAVEAMLRASGLRVLERVEDEIYLCEPNHETAEALATWSGAEYHAVTAQQWSASSNGNGSAAKDNKE